MKVILYPRSIRIWHWAQALAMLVLIVTGAELRFPDHVSVFGSLGTAVRVHNLAGLVVGVGWLAWLILYIARRDLVRQYLVRPRDLGEPAARQLAYYAYGIFQGWRAPFHPTPEAKFNPLQKVTYALVMFLLVPVQTITGILLYDVDRFRTLIDVAGGIRFVDAIHVLLAYAFVAFLIAHVYLSTLGATFFGHIKAMIVGYEDEAHSQAHEPAHEAPPPVLPEPGPARPEAIINDAEQKTS
jgi:thiosulfate reductase cytochrome b subunit